MDSSNMGTSYKEILRERNQNNKFANMIGLSIVEIKEGYAVTRMKIRDEMRNPIGSIHGGCLYTMADVSTGAAVSSYGMQITTLDSSFHFMRPGLGDIKELIGRGKVIKHGKRVSVAEVTVEDDHGTVLAQGIFTFMSLGKPIGPPFSEETKS